MRYLLPVTEEAIHFRDELISNYRNSLPVFHEHAGQLRDIVLLFLEIHDEHAGQLLDIVLLFLEIHVFNLMDGQNNRTDDFFWFMMTFFLIALCVNNDRWPETEN